MIVSAWLSAQEARRVLLPSEELRRPSARPVLPQNHPFGPRRSPRGPPLPAQEEAACKVAFSQERGCSGLRDWLMCGA